MTSLIPSESKLLVVTATATKANQIQILETFGMKSSQIYKIEKSPNRPNLMFNLTYLDKDIPYEDLFSPLIEDVKKHGVSTDRTLIYCQTRKQCSVLFRLFQISLGDNMYYGECKPRNRIVEMYHAGTPSSVKEHVTQLMSEDCGHLRILIATVAFGMGVNCKEVRRTIHFGPSKNIEQYVQESGRAGRDGKQSSCVLLFNGILATHCEKEMKDVLHSEECRRKYILHHFGYESEYSGMPCHLCCDVCACHCDCGSDDCGKHWSLESEAVKVDQPTRTKKVNEMQKLELKQKLVTYKNYLCNASNSSLRSKVPSCPSVFLEFNLFHIQQVLNKCHVLFNMKDVFEHCEIWHQKYAKSILKILAEVFDDIEEVNADEMSSDEEDIFSTSTDMVWYEIKNDSSLFSLFDSQILAEDDSEDQSDMDQSDMSFGNNSSLFNFFVPK